MNDRYLTIALCKGRVANQTMDLLEKLGIKCDEIKDKSTRKLIFTKRTSKNSSSQKAPMFRHMWNTELPI